MSEMRYRKPSPKTMLGLTKWKKRVKKALGINVLMWPFRAMNNYKRRVLRRTGYYTPQMKAMRAMQRGQVAGPIGPLQVGERGEQGREGSGNNLLMAAMLAKGMGGEEHGKHGAHEPDDKSLLLAAALSQGGKHGKGDEPDEGGSHLAQAMLLASALGGAHEPEAPAAKRPRGKAAQPKAAPDKAPAAPKTRAKRAAANQPSADEQAKEQPKRRRGPHVLSLLLMALLTAVAIMAAWYFWLA